MGNQHPSLYHYVYLVTNGIQSYVGSRSSEVPPEDDIEYVGSPTDPVFKKSITKKFIIKTFKSRAEASEYEANLHNNWNVDTNNNFANRARASLEPEGFKIPVGYKWPTTGRKRFSEYKKENPSKQTPQSIRSSSIKNSLKSSTGLYREKIVFRERNAFTQAEIHHFVHVSGLSYMGTMQSFIDIFDVSYSGVSELKNGKIRVHRGWERINDQSGSS